MDKRRICRVHETATRPMRTDGECMEARDRSGLGAHGCGRVKGPLGVVGATANDAANGGPPVQQRNGRLAGDEDSRLGVDREWDREHIVCGRNQRQRRVMGAAVCHGSAGDATRAAGCDVHGG
jgi:hypothetical protein